MQVEAGLVQMRETAYGKVLQCLPYPRELVSLAPSPWQCATGLMNMAMHLILLSSIQVLSRSLAAACGRPLAPSTHRLSTRCPIPPSNDMPAALI